MDSEFKVGKIFYKTYPVEAATWCNEHNCYIEELSLTSTGHRRFKIIERVVEEEENIDSGSGLNE